MNQTTRPVLERIEPDFGSSLSMHSFDVNNPNPNLSFWHYHPELEIVYVNNGSGKRQIGSHLSYYRNGDLILIGSNLPHCGFTGQLKKNQKETVVQWRKNLFGSEFIHTPEMSQLHSLFDRAKKGVIFHGQDKRRIGKKIAELVNLEPYDRLLGLMRVFKDMSESSNYTILNAKGYLLEAKFEDHDRINRVFNFVKDEFHRHIPIEEIASFINMTPPSFCRYFKKVTNKTFTQFVNEYRLVHAANLLHEKQISITEVCFASGFNNFSHFTKKFKEFAGRSPSVYRNEISYNVTEESEEERAMDLTTIL